MKKRLVSIGNSLGIVIEKPILDLLGMDRDTELDVSTDGQRLILSPSPSAPNRPRGRSKEANYAQLPQDWASRSIRVLRPDNPKRVGSTSRLRFAKYKNGMTGAEAIAAGILKIDLGWDLKRQFIEFIR